MLIHHAIDVYFLLETKRAACTEKFVNFLWNEQNIRWTSIDAVGKSGGVLVLWNDNNFRVNSIEYGGQWIAIFGVHSSSDFACAVVGVYAASLVFERRTL
jgi:hypothetical protein